jgi:hypothetical protein
MLPQGRQQPAERRIVLREGRRCGRTPSPEQGLLKILPGRLLFKTAGVRLAHPGLNKSRPGEAGRPRKDRYREPIDD